MKKKDPLAKKSFHVIHGPKEGKNFPMPVSFSKLEDAISFALTCEGMGMKTRVKKPKEKKPPEES